ncbi:hypothetical protein [Streptomyces griseoviridis]|uniref:hypothetical protein n=1 Tax=Streptomyces griseoviridis TaxID=45398 RepID=UPI0033CE6164
MSGLTTGFAGLLRFDFRGFGEAAGGVGPGVVELAVVAPVRDVLLASAFLENSAPQPLRRSQAAGL